MDGGRIDIRPAGSMRDDLAVVVALCVNELSKNQGVVNAPQLGIIGFIPRSCPVVAICRNFPNCLDVSSCQGFKDERVTGLPRHLIGDKVDNSSEEGDLQTRLPGSAG